MVLTVIGLGRLYSWEQLPIVLKSHMDPMFKGVANVLLVDKFEDVTLEMLDRFDYKDVVLRPDSIFARYWYDQITNKRVKTTN